MAANNDDLLISISTDLTTVRRQLKQLTSDIGQTASGVQKQFDAMGKGIDQSLSPVQKRINDMMGIASTGTKPLKEWKGALADAAVGFTAVGKGAALTSNQMLNLSRQGNDVITMFALGAHPMQIFASQAGQIYDALEQGNGGIKGSLKAIGESAMGLVTKFPLATAAVAAAGVAVVAYLAIGGSSLKSLDEILKTHEANIKRLGDAYDEVAGKQHKYAADTALTVNQLNKQDAQDAADLLSKQTLDILGKVDANLASFDANGRFAAFAEPIKKLMDEFKNGTPDIMAFRDAINRIADANPQLDGMRKQILDFSADAAVTAAKLPDLAKSVSDVTDTVNQFNLQLASVDSKPLQKELQDLFDKAREGKEPIDGILASLAALEQANPSFSGIIAGFTDLIKKAYEASAAMDSIRPAGQPVNGRQSLPVGILPDTAPTPDARPNAEDVGAANDKLAARAARKAAQPQKKTADDRFAEDIQSIKDRTAALNEEYNSLGLSFEAQTQRKTALDLEQEALKQVREEARKKGDVDWQNAQLSPAQVKAIDDVSDAYAKQADQLRKAQEMQDLQRDVLKGVFDDLRGALDDGKLDWHDFAKIAESALDKIIDKIENDLINSIMDASNAGSGGGGILGSILGLFTGGGGSSSFGPPGGFAEMLGIPGYAGGTNNHPGGLAIVGEKGPELLNLPRGSQVMPRVPSIQAGGGGGGAQAVSISVNVSGATGNQEVMAMVREGVTQGIGQFSKSPAFTRSTAKSLRDIRVTSGGQF